MSKPDERHEARHTIEIEPELRARVAAAAAERGLSVRDYVAAVLRLAVEHTGKNRTSDQATEWSRLSVPAFARDWESDADAVYDDLAKRRRGSGSSGLHEPVGRQAATGGGRLQ